MPLGSIDIGTITIANGSKHFTGTGVFWSIVREFDFLFAGGVGAGVIDSIDPVTFADGELKSEWQAASLVDAPYIIVNLPVDAALSRIEIRQVVEFLRISQIIYYLKPGDVEPDPALGEQFQVALYAVDGSFKTWIRIDGVWVLQANIASVGGSVAEAVAAAATATTQAGISSGAATTSSAASGAAIAARILAEAAAIATAADRAATLADRNDAAGYAALALELATLLGNPDEGSMDEAASQTIDEGIMV